MSFKNTLDLVIKDIQEIEKIISKFQNYSRIPAIELDLTLNKLQNLYELILMIREHQDGTKDSPDFELEKSPSEIADDLKKQDQEISYIQKAPIINTNSELSDSEELTEIEEDIVKEDETTTKPKDKELTVAEKFENRSEFLNEKFADNSGSSMSRAQGGPINSIASAIGINDRFYYIREIFDGNSDNFKKHIEALDKTTDFNEAFNYMKTQLMIDLDNEAVQNLLNLIRRKFITPGNE